METTTETQNKVGLGSSTTGVVSGVLGVAAAAAIFTPAGAPLLIASLLFGGSATAVQTGTEVRNFYSEPNQLADRMIALHGVLVSILNITGVLRDAMLRDHIRSDHYDPPKRSDAFQKAMEKNRVSLLGGLAASRFSMAGVEMSRAVSVAETGAVTTRNARFFSRTGTNLMRMARFARFAGGALSAAILVLEAKSMTNTIQEMQSGNPCEKADRLREMKEEIAGLPKTSELDKECETYLQAMIDRQRALTEEEVTKILVEQSEAALKEAQEMQLLLQQESAEQEADNSGAVYGASILDGEEAAPSKSDTPSALSVSSSSSSPSKMSMSLLERIELFKQKEAADDGNELVKNASTKTSESSDDEDEETGEPSGAFAYVPPTSSDSTEVVCEVEPSAKMKISAAN